MASTHFEGFHTNRVVYSFLEMVGKEIEDPADSDNYTKEE